jgi:hypothetical protein
MSSQAVVALVQALMLGIPKLIELVKAGRSLKDIRLADFISTDALAKIEAADQRAGDFIENG